MANPVLDLIGTVFGLGPDTELVQKIQRIQKIHSDWQEHRLRAEEAFAQIRAVELEGLKGDILALVQEIQSTIKPAKENRCKNGQ